MLSSATLVCWIGAVVITAEPLDDDASVAAQRLLTGDPDKELARLRGEILDGYKLCFAGSGVEPEPVRELRRFAEPVVPILRSRIDFGPEKSRHNAIWLAAVLGTRAESLAPQLARLASDMQHSSTTRIAACEALVYVTPESRPVLPLVTLPLELWPAGPPEVSGAGLFVDMIVVTLMCSGHVGVEVPRALHLLESDRREVRVMIIAVFSGLGPEAAAALPSLRALLRDPDRDIRFRSALAILHVERDAQRVQWLSRQLAEPDRNIFVEEADDLVATWEKERRDMAWQLQDEVGLQAVLGTLRRGSTPMRSALIRLLPARELLPREVVRALAELERTAQRASETDGGAEDGTGPAPVSPGRASRR